MQIYGYCKPSDDSPSTPPYHAGLTFSGRSPTLAESPQARHFGADLAYALRPSWPPLHRELGGRLGSIETPTQLVERDDSRLVTFSAERRFEIFDQGLPELGVGDRASDDVVELATDARKFLGRLYPPLRGRWKRPQELSKACLVVRDVRGHRSQDGSADGFLPSNSSRSFARQREMRLAIVPAGMSSASPMAW
jgi:hypothetical protein